MIFVWLVMDLAKACMTGLSVRPAKAPEKNLNLKTVTTMVMIPKEPNTYLANEFGLEHRSNNEIRSIAYRSVRGNVRLCDQNLDMEDQKQLADWLYSFQQ